MRRSAAGRVAILLLVALAGGLVLASCGGGGDQDATVLPAGQVDIKLPPGYEVVDGKVVTPAGATKGGGNAAGGSSVTTTIPLDREQDPTTAMFDALAKFRACLDGLGVKFVGAPDAADPSSPANDPDYVSSLSTCAARSNIVQALQAAQSANDDLTPEEIKTRNKQYLKWRKCMIGRGWKIAEPVPDEQGRLFSFGTNSANQIQPPPGKDLLTSNDTQECAAKLQRQSQSPSGS